MRWIQDTVAEFGRQIGLEGLELGAQGVVQLSLASGGLVAVEPVRRGEQDEVLVYMGRVAGHGLAGLLRVALTKAHVAQGGPLPVQVACRGSGPEALLLALVRLPERAFTPQALAHAVDFLARWLDDVQAGNTR